MRMMYENLIFKGNSAIQVRHARGRSMMTSRADAVLSDSWMANRLIPDVEQADTEEFPGSFSSSAWSDLIDSTIKTGCG